MSKEKRFKNKKILLVGIVVAIIIFFVILAIVIKNENKKELNKEPQIINDNISNNEFYYNDKNYNYSSDENKSTNDLVKEENKENNASEEKNNLDRDKDEISSSNNSQSFLEEEQNDKEEFNDNSNNQVESSIEQNNSSINDEISDYNLRKINVYNNCPNISKNIETFYSDENYDYQSNNFQTSCTYVTISGKEYLLRDALYKNLVTIEELEDIGVFFKKNLKNKLTKGIIIDDRCGITAQAIETFYSDNNYDYQFNSIKSSCIYAIVNGKEYTIKKALNDKIITIEEASNAGLHFTRKSKNNVLY